MDQRSIGRGGVEPATGGTAVAGDAPAVQVEHLDLEAISEQVRVRASASSAGRAARTLHHGQLFRQTLLALRADASLAEHDNPGEATLHLLSGRVRLTTASTAVTGEQGSLLLIPAEPHALHAITDAVAVLTTALRR